MFNIKTYTVILFSALFMNVLSAKPALSQSNGDDQFKLSAFPNPSSSSLTITYNIPQNTAVKLMIFSVDGSVGKVLYAGNRPAGDYSETYDISTLAPGQYFYQLQTETDLVTKPISMVGDSAKQN